MNTIKVVDNNNLKSSSFKKKIKNVNTLPIFKYKSFNDIVKDFIKLANSPLNKFHLLSFDYDNFKYKNDKKIISNTKLRKVNNLLLKFKNVIKEKGFKLKMMDFKDKEYINRLKGYDSDTVNTLIHKFLKVKLNFIDDKTILYLPLEKETRQMNFIYYNIFVDSEKTKKIMFNIEGRFNLLLYNKSDIFTILINKSSVAQMVKKLTNNNCVICYENKFNISYKNDPDLLKAIHCAVCGSMLCGHCFKKEHKRQKIKIRIGQIYDPFFKCPVCRENLLKDRFIY